MQKWDKMMVQPWLYNPWTESYEIQNFGYQWLHKMVMVTTKDLKKRGKIVIIYLSFLCNFKSKKDDYVPSFDHVSVHSYYGNM